MPEEFKVSGPGPGRPAGAWTNSDHVDHCAVFGNPVEAERVSTRNNEKYVVAACEFVVCLNCARAWTDTDVSGKALAPRLLSADGPIVAARLTLGEARQGQNPPVIPGELVAGEVEEVQRVLTKYAGRMPSGRVVFDVVQFNADHPAEPPSPTQ